MLKPRKYQPEQVYPKAAQALERGASLRGVQRRMHLTDEEIKDIDPEAFDDASTDRRNGY